ncbi:MAG: hypothetical protein AUJ98_06475 [Bacteroidetes bacterium CG2_30_33_31]|nr:MAG: hypothetical protein AUJ98_06475 [Bacteroidetes bacterium CG2_30_33_31]
MLYAVIDIGSNAVRLLFANAQLIENEIVVEKATLIRIPLRLGIDAFTIGKISLNRKVDFVKTMQAFQLLIDVYKPQEYCALATAAMREAANSIEILNEVKEKVGMDIKIISGREEASIIRSTNKLEIMGSSNPVIFIDVGGGSTDISVEIDGHLIKLKSFKIGTLRILNDSYPKNIWKEIFSWLQFLKDDYEQVFCVGSGGNINKINKLYGDSESKILAKSNLLSSYNYLNSLTIEERMSKFGFREDRADVIVPAAEIYLKILDFLNVESIIVPKIGLADGMVHILYEKHLKKISKAKIQ